MLASLTIQNVVLIDQVTVNFAAGLCALTGETGAGKSILLDSLGLALGARSEGGIVRKGADQASVRAVFEVEDSHPVHAFLESQGLIPDASLVLRRTVSAEGGRSRAFINDQPVSAGLLRHVGEMLVEIHGQFETQGLLNTATHRDLLDAYGTDLSLLKTLEAAWQDWKVQESALAELQARLEKSRAEESFLRGALEDLDALSIEEGEEDRLVELRTRLSKRAQYLDLLNRAHESFSAAEKGLSGGWRALEKMDGVAKDLLAGANRASVEIQEVLNGISALFSDMETSEYSLEAIDDRLFALKGMARKHGCMVADLAQKRDEFARALNEIEHTEDVLGARMKDAARAKARYIDTARSVSEARKVAAARLDTLVAAELGPLKLDKARFETCVEELTGEEHWGPSGTSRVQFLVATNPGAAAGPMGKIASGGELARFMLALKVVLAGTGLAGTLVFDEVDSGIGGAVADAVGERLARLANAAGGRQILVVTHAPQVAARADHHFIVKKDGEESLRTQAVALETIEARREEIARMLAGAEITVEARAAASKLLENGAEAGKRRVA